MIENVKELQAALYGVHWYEVSLFEEDTIICHFCEIMTDITIGCEKHAKDCTRLEWLKRHDMIRDFQSSVTFKDFYDLVGHVVDKEFIFVWLKDGAE